MKTILAGAALAAAIVSPALADFFIVQDANTKRCTIVEQRPAPGLGIVVGDRGFGVRLDAESSSTPESSRSRATTYASDSSG